MGKHYFHETTHLVKDSHYHRLIYCEWCGIVVWDFNRLENSLKELQDKAGGDCQPDSKA